MDKDKLKQIDLMTRLVLVNCRDFFKEMEYKIDQNIPLSLLEQQLINEYTLTYIQVIGIRKQLKLK